MRLNQSNLTYVDDSAKKAISSNMKKDSIALFSRSDADNRIVLYNLANAMAVEALALCVATPSAGSILTL